MKESARTTILAWLIVLAFGRVDTATAQGIELLSKVPEIAIIRLSVLPPTQKSADTDCARLPIEPTSRGGKAVAARGWSVTGELDISGLTVVSFVGGVEPGTSGACLMHDGNVGFFAGEQLLAIAYGSSPKSTPARIEALGTTGARIWDGDYLSQPIADVQLGKNAVTIVPLAAEDRFCDGRAIVPNVYGKHAAEATKQLAEYGWKPEQQPSEEPAGSNCSGTGFGFCSFVYRSDTAALSIVTAGEEPPSVVGYDVDCKP